MPFIKSWNFSNVSDLNTVIIRSVGDSNKEGIAIDHLTSNIGLSLLISEPTNFQENSNPLTSSSVISLT